MQVAATRNVRLMVRRNRTLQSDGTGEEEEVVTCPVRGCSTGLGECARCTRHRPAQDTAATILCEIEAPRDDDDARVDVAEAAAITRVGELVSRAAVCVQHDVSADLAITRDARLRAGGQFDRSAGRYLVPGDALPRAA
jgi:hypothetical protein